MYGTVPCSSQSALYVARQDTERTQQELAQRLDPCASEESCQLLGSLARKLPRSHSVVHQTFALADAHLL